MKRWTKFIGRDPYNENPVVLPTTAKGPKPIGVAVAGGTIPGITTPGSASQSTKDVQSSRSLLMVERICTGDEPGVQHVDRDLHDRAEDSPLNDGFLLGTYPHPLR